MADFELPERGVVFWPVGNGDAVTVVIDKGAGLFVQVDVNHYASADDEGDPRVPVVDRLLGLLPRPEGAEKPVLPVLAITHHDDDHCSGFKRLIDEVQVCELWLTLRSFIEEKSDGLTEDGQDVYDEACRRRAAEVAAHARGQRAAPGMRLRIIGNADVLDDPDWSDFPTDLLTSAGQYVPCVNDEDVSDRAEFFVHTPFHEDTEDGDRNSSSLGMQVTLKDGDCEQRYLLLGDLCYTEIEAFFEKSEQRNNDDRLYWDVLLAPHHGSKNAVMRKEGDDWVDADAVDYLTDYKGPAANVVVSSRLIGDVSDGDTDPPHQEALDIYEDMVGSANVLYSGNSADGSDSDPVVLLATASDCGESKAARMERLKTVGIIKGRDDIRSGDRHGSLGDQGFA